MTEIVSAPLWMTLAVLGGFLLDWAAVGWDWKKLKPIAKFLAMALVILWTLFAVRFEVHPLVAMLLAAQVFGLLGDCCLLFPERWFYRGVGAFLIGHFFYIGLLVALLVRGLQEGMFVRGAWWVIAGGILLWAGLLGAFFRVYASPIQKSATHRAAWPPVLFYASILSGMTALSICFVFLVPGTAWADICLAVGAVLFFASDGILAYNRFVRELPRGHLWIHMTYHLAQINLAVGFVNWIADFMD